jgi:hypothetical protein
MGCARYDGKLILLDERLAFAIELVDTAHAMLAVQVDERIEDELA